MAAPDPLSTDRLYRHCDPKSLPFETTTELADLDQIIGQDRALDALHFGTGIQSEGFNLFVLGPNGMGKETVVRHFLEHRAADASVPPDRIYVHNFEVPNRPRLLELPAGQGRRLRDDLDGFVDELRTALPATFESEEHQNRVHELQQEFNQRQEEAIQEVREEAEKRGISLLQTPNGFTFAPVKDGEVLGPDEFQQLEESERRRLETEISELQEKLQWVMRQIPKWRKESQEKVDELNREMADMALGQLLEQLQSDHGEVSGVPDYLQAVRQDVIDHVDVFRQEDNDEAFETILDQYRANLLVDNSDLTGAPIIHEDLPTHQHLVGRVEHRAEQGALFTDYRLIRPGALHQAHGGYLILDIRQLLMQPVAWETLKRTLYAGEVRIESLQEIYSFLSTESLEPDPAPLDVKVILLGDRFLYYLLSEYDPDFRELFKVQADFEEDFERTADNNPLYARLIATLARRESLRPLDADGVARVIEHGSRLAEDSERLALHAGDLADLLREAHFWAGEAGRGTITRTDIQTAVDKARYRGDRLRERTQRAIQRDILLIDTQGARVGQINGLAVMQIGDTVFGRPHRITATARLGDGQVVDIERETDLGGDIHSKGVLILTSFLGARYARERSLSVHASLTFEQSYGLVEGDSASAAELCALLSALADIPLDQGLAITGSVNQHGQIQAIGGANEKIEGFFDTCRERGLTGEQSVLMPRANIPHLMLREDVRDAAEAGDFHVYPVGSVDEALALLTGLPAGEPDAEGRFPEGSVNRRVADRLAELTALQRRDRSDSDDGE